MISKLKPFLFLLSLVVFSSASADEWDNVGFGDIQIGDQLNNQTVVAPGIVLQGDGSTPPLPVKKERRNCDQSNNCYDTPKEKPAPEPAPAPAPGPAVPANPQDPESGERKVPSHILTKANQCLRAATKAQSTCEDSKSEVDSKESEADSIRNAARSQTVGAACMELASRAQSTIDGASGKSNQCKSAQTSCDSLCNASEFNSLASYGDNGTNLMSQISEARSKCTTAANLLSRMRNTIRNLQDVATSADKCLQDITGGANPASALNPSANPSFNTGDTSNICLSNPRACGGSDGVNSGGYSAPVPGPGKTEDDRAGVKRNGLDLGDDRAAVGSLASDDGTRAASRGDSGEMPGPGAPASVGNGFGQGPEKKKNSGGGYYAPTPPEVFRGYYAPQGGVAFGNSPGAKVGEAVAGQVQQKPTGPVVGSKLTFQKGEVRKMWQARMQTELQRKMAGFDRVDGVVGPDGLTGPNSLLFYKVRTRYNRLEQSLIP